MQNKFKNYLSFPFNSNLVFKTTESLLNKSPGGYILSFHDLSPEVFSTHVESLKPAIPVSLNELIDRYKLGKSIKNCFAITFDDGVKSTIKNNWEICMKNNWPVTFYLPTNYINGDNLPFQKIELLESLLKNENYKLPKTSNNTTEKVLNKKKLINYLNKIIYVKNNREVEEILNYFLKILQTSYGLKYKKDLMPKAINWEEIKQISKNELASFQSHSLSHAACSGLSKQELENEMLTSKRIIEDCTGKNVNSFCYPYGAPKSISKLSVEIASKYFDHATTLIKGRLNKKSNLHYLPRIDLYPDQNVAFARMKVALS